MDGLLNSGCRYLRYPGRQPEGRPLLSGRRTLVSWLQSQLAGLSGDICEINSIQDWSITCFCIIYRQSNQQAGHDRWINEALDNVDDKSTKDANISAKGVLALSGSLSGTMCWPFGATVFNLRLKLRNVEPRLCEPLTYWKKNFKRVNAANIEYWRAEESKNLRQ